MTLPSWVDAKVMEVMMIMMMTGPQLDLTSRSLQGRGEGAVGRVIEGGRRASMEAAFWRDCQFTTKAQHMNRGSWLFP